MKLAPFVFVTLFLSCAVPAVNAEEPICAAVNPCNADGTVMKEFAGGECAAVFERRCLSQLTNSLQMDVAACRADEASTTEQLGEANRQIAALRRQLKAALRKAAR